MSREPLEKGTELDLTDESGKKHHFRVEKLESDEGASCLCYRVEKNVWDQYVVKILKEYYPAGDPDSRRSQEQRLELSDAAIKGKGRFVQAVEFAKKFAETDDSLAESIAIDVNAGIMTWATGNTKNSTVYCMNKYFAGQKVWSEIGSSDQPEEIEAVLTCVENIAKFLNDMHLKEWAYVDLKEENILLKYNEMEGYVYQRPIFFDFDSVLPFDTYGTDEIQTSVHNHLGIQVDVGNRVDVFAGNKNVEEVDERVDIKALKSMLKRKIDNTVRFGDVSRKAKEELDKVILSLESPSELKESIDETCMCWVMNEMRRVKEHIIDEECEKTKDIFEKYQNKYKCLFKVLFPVSLILYVFVIALYSSCCVYNDWMQPLVEGDRIKLILGIFGLVVVITTVLKLWLQVVVSKMEKANVACTYYKDKKNRSDKNTFPKSSFKRRKQDANRMKMKEYVQGQRKDAAYQDDSIANTTRQDLRLKLWIILALEILGGFSLSVFVHSFPIFIAVGLAAILIFMFWDLIPSNQKFYESYADYMMNTSMKFLKNSEFIKKRDCMPLYYRDEWECTKEDNVFDKSTEYNKKSKWNVHDLDGIVQRLREQTIGSDEAIIIKQIYKMAWDRLKNKQLIINFVIIFFSIFMVFLDISSFGSMFRTYFRIPETVYMPFTLVVIIGTGIAICVQMIRYVTVENKIAQIGYKSMFIVNFELGKVLADDIKNKIILPIDIVRGVYQYNGAAFTSGRNVKIYDKIMFCHREIANRRRLDITVGLIFGIVFSVLVWHFRLYYLIPVIVISSAIIYMILKKYYLPNIGKNRLKKMCEDLDKKCFGV